jgi:cytochrome c oxidase cbb3-type subunit 3
MTRYTLLLLCIFILLNPTAHAKSGAALYAQHCAACHGADGNGGVGVPLTLPDFQYSVTDDFLKKTIRLGRPGRVMPAFPSLNNEDLEKLVKYIRRWAPGKPFTYPTTKITGNKQNGKILFLKKCASCHGQHGEGGKGTGITFSRPRDLPIIAPALNNSGFLSAASDHIIKATLMNGRDGTPMVSFLKQGLTEQEINDLVVYVRSFEKSKSNIQSLETKTEKPYVVVESPYNFKTTIDNLKTAAVGSNFIIIREQPLNQGLVEKGKENVKQQILYFCNFSFLNKALAIDPRIGLFLPCRITVVERQGKVFVYAINPRRLSKLFNNIELNKLCKEMSETYISIIEDATL